LVLIRYQIIDTQVARRGHQYHATHPTKTKKRIRLVKENKKPPTHLQKDKILVNASKNKLKKN
jgi:hypothetical protein